jgi:hypothetical protein
MYLTDFNMTLDTKLVDCFSELTLDKIKINELFEIHQNELKKDETKQDISNETNDDTYVEYTNEIKCNKCGKSSASTSKSNQFKSNNRSATTRVSRSVSRRISNRR